MVSFCMELISLAGYFMKDLQWSNEQCFCWEETLSGRCLEGWTSSVTAAQRIHTWMRSRLCYRSQILHILLILTTWQGMFSECLHGWLSKCRLEILICWCFNLQMCVMMNILLCTMRLWFQPLWHTGNLVCRKRSIEKSLTLWGPEVTFFSSADNIGKEVQLIQALSRLTLLARFCVWDYRTDIQHQVLSGKLQFLMLWWATIYREGNMSVIKRWLNHRDPPGDWFFSHTCPESFSSIHTKWSRINTTAFIRLCSF